MTYRTDNIVDFAAERLRRRGRCVRVEIELDASDLKRLGTSDIESLMDRLCVDEVVIADVRESLRTQ